MITPLHIKNAAIHTQPSTQKRDLYCSDVILNQPAPYSILVDLEGYTIVPGLINAHDHLELNHYPRTKFRDVYNNAHEWGDDVDKRLDTEPYKSLQRYPLWDRLFIGGLKNLLCGATTVAHHGPQYSEMYRRDFPVRVLKNYGWAHSLHFDTDKQVVASYQKTPPDFPWFIHLAEGIDNIARDEYQHLKALGCVGENTVIIHGVGLTGRDLFDASDISNILGIVVCPTTNKYLLDMYPNIDLMQEVGIHVMIGSDSRLTANGDLLNELHVVDASDNHVTNNWKLIRSDYQPLNTGEVADFFLLDASTQLSQIDRSQIRLIVKSGIPQIGDPALMEKFTHIETVSALLDGVPKSVHIPLARQIQRCKLKESGLELLEAPQKRFWIF